MNDYLSNFHNKDPYTIASDKIITTISKLIYAIRYMAGKTSQNMTIEDVLEESLYDEGHLKNLHSILEECNKELNAADLEETRGIVRTLLINADMERLKYEDARKKYNNTYELLANAQKENKELRAQVYKFEAMKESLKKIKLLKKYDNLKKTILYSLLKDKKC